MNFGEKFPYALLTFSQSLSSWLLGAPSPKVCRSWLLGTLHPNHYLHAQLHINPIPHTPTPTIHQPYTSYTPTPIPLLLRVDSDEMRQNRKVFAHEVLEYSQRAPYGAKSPRSGLRASYKQGLSGAQRLFVAGAQTKVDEECFSESCRVCAVKVPANLTIFPKITQTVKKLPNSPTYHLMVTNITELHRISPDYTR